MTEHPTKASPEHSRRDGWTPERQAAFLAVFARTHSVTAAARAVGMSRESAHRLRARSDGALFAYLWDQALLPAPLPHESHNLPLTDGRLLRLLSNHYRRKSGDFTAIGVPRARRGAG